MKLSLVRLAAIGALAVTAIACGGGDSTEAAPPVPGAEDGDARDVDATPADEDAERREIEAILKTAYGDDTTEMPKDRDGDGIDDVTEELLLRRYRPYLKFSKDSSGNDESHRPMDPIAVLKDAQLAQFKGDGQGSTDPLAGCGRATDHHLDPPAQLLTCRKDTSLLTNFTKTSYSINVANADYGGASFESYKKNADGFFGHVVSDTVGGHPAYKIEFWQYYAFNNQDIGVAQFRDFGDHEGDWTGLQLWFDRKEGRIAQVLYLIHGKKAEFHFTADMDKTTCKSCFVTVKGKNFDAKPGNFFDDAQRAQYTDNQAELWVDAEGYKHVVAYVENGGHESWPGAWGHADIVVDGVTIAHPNPHGGDGTNLLAPIPARRPLNAGEVEKPLTPEYGIILQYNGYWGSTNTNDLGVRVRKSPPGPASHCEWKFPKGPAVPHCEN